MANTPLTVELSDQWEATVYRQWSFSAELVTRWNGLASAYGDAGVFLTHGAFTCWWDSFGGAAEPLVTVIRHAGEVRGIFPCQLAPGKSSRRELGIRSLTNSESHCFDFLVEEQGRRETLSRFLSTAQRLFPGKGITIDKMPEGGPNTQLFLEVLAARRGCFYDSFTPCAPWLQVPSCASELSGRLSGRLQKTLRQSRKRAQREGHLSLQVVTGSDCLDAVLSEVFDAEYRSWKGRAGTAVKCREDADSFYRALARQAMQEQALLLFLLRLDDRVTAACFCLARGKTLFVLKTGYDEGYRHLTPGILLLEEVLSYCRDQGGFALCDLRGVCEPWKMEWTDKTGSSGVIRVFPASVAGTLEYLTSYGWKLYLKRFRVVRYCLERFRQ
ncbi:GNAT family N-acetyltransferase [Geomonas propionica]|uniref:GNAT family N-acetyltransferase n=1 Tax=Geomonas propionica TaxID=2798582 RepID=A0ABS0YU01_9BACT|nr:GNAT family N-acetyltransferase [Geomonas propionica]MBJ6801408.1 GNAT family N-acetyltransferase [Geomonas propionica]